MTGGVYVDSIAINPFKIELGKRNCYFLGDATLNNMKEPSEYLQK